MGLYDSLTCRYPLPVSGANELRYLWHETYDIEERSDPKAEGIMRVAGMLSRINKRWEAVPLTGEVRFYTTLGDNHSGWLEFSSYFVAGKINQLHLIRHELPD